MRLRYGLGHPPIEMSNVEIAAAQACVVAGDDILRLRMMHACVFFGSYSQSWLQLQTCGVWLHVCCYMEQSSTLCEQRCACCCALLHDHLQGVSRAYVSGVLNKALQKINATQEIHEILDELADAH